MQKKRISVHNFTPCTKIDQIKWIIDLNVKLKIIKFLEEDRRKISVTLDRAKAS